MADFCKRGFLMDLRLLYSWWKKPLNCSHMSLAALAQNAASLPDVEAVQAAIHFEWERLRAAILAARELISLGGGFGAL